MKQWEQIRIKGHLNLKYNLPYREKGLVWVGFTISLEVEMRLHKVTEKFKP